jgi:hypothetical protein
VWIDKCQNAFIDMKKRLCEAPILRGPKWTLPFYISMDASDTAIDTMLGKHEDHTSYSIYFISKNLTAPELNYTVTEKNFSLWFML